ncbi:MAG: hypothetical protein AAF488_11765 [Planctomycetota bacterium]
MTRLRTMLVCVGFVALLATATGCSSATPRPEYTRFYGDWQHLAESERQALDSARVQASAEFESIDHLLGYARVTTRLAREEAHQWFSVHEHTVTDGTIQRHRAASTRGRLLQSCHHGIALYREVQLEGGTLTIQDQLNLLWLLMFSERPLEAENQLSALERNPHLTDDVAGALARIRRTLTNQGGSDGSQ